MRYYIFFIVAIFSAVHVSTVYAKEKGVLDSQGKYDVSVLQKDDLHFLSIHDNSMMEAMVGETIVVVLDTFVDPNYEIQLMYRDKKVVSAPLLEKDSTQFALIGIPHGIVHGSYALVLASVSLEEHAQTSDFLAKQVILLKERNTFEERIVLNKNLSTKRSAFYHKKVVEQAKNMWQLTKEVFEDDYFAYDNFILPVKSYKYFSGMYSDKRVFVDVTGNILSSTIHGGIDIAASTGTPVLSPAKGRVVFTGNRIVTGNTIVVSHFPGVYSLFYHLSDIQVEENDRINKNEIIGEIGNSGFSTGPHLHWELRVNNVRIDPILSMGVLDKVFILAVE